MHPRRRRSARPRRPAPRIAAGAPALVDPPLCARRPPRTSRPPTGSAPSGTSTGAPRASAPRREESTDSHRSTTACGCCARTPPGGASRCRPTSCRCALAIRANQLLVGGSRCQPRARAVALADLAGGTGRLTCPSSTGTAALGTGDLTALRRGRPGADRRAAPRRRRHRRSDLQLTSADALPLMSSNAFALAETGAGTPRRCTPWRAQPTRCAALSLVGPARQPRGGQRPRRQRATPFPGAARGRPGAARAARRPARSSPHTSRTSSACAPGRRCTDRSWTPSTTSSAVVETVGQHRLGEPALHAGDGDRAGPVTHHGGFHAAYLVLAMDTTLLALTPLGAGGAVADQPPAHRLATAGCRCSCRTRRRARRGC